MQDSLDFLVAAAQVAFRIGSLHIVVMADAAREHCKQFVTDVIARNTCCEFSELLRGVLIQSHCPGTVGKGGGGARLLAFMGCITRAKGRWRHHLILLIHFISTHNSKN